VQSISHGNHNHTPHQITPAIPPSSPTSRRLLRTWSPFAPVLPTLTFSNKDSMGPMQGLFATSPPSSAGLSGQGSTNRNRASFPGVPVVDMTLHGDEVEQRTVGEFGEPLRPGPDLVRISVVLWGGLRVRTDNSRRRYCSLDDILRIEPRRSPRYTHTPVGPLQITAQTPPEVRAHTVTS